MTNGITLRSAGALRLAWGAADAGRWAQRRNEKKTWSLGHSIPGSGRVGRKRIISEAEFADRGMDRNDGIRPAHSRHLTKEGPVQLRHHTGRERIHRQHSFGKAIPRN